jgi:hypothetical protein
LKEDRFLISFVITTKEKPDYTLQSSIKVKQNDIMREFGIGLFQRREYGMEMRRDPGKCNFLSREFEIQIQRNEYFMLNKSVLSLIVCKMINWLNKYEKSEHFFLIIRWSLISLIFRLAIVIFIYMVECNLGPLDWSWNVHAQW